MLFHWLKYGKWFAGKQSQNTQTNKQKKTWEDLLADCPHTIESFKKPMNLRVISRLVAKNAVPKSAQKTSIGCWSRIWSENNGSSDRYCRSRSCDLYLNAKEQVAQLELCIGWSFRSLIPLQSCATSDLAVSGHSYLNDTNNNLIMGRFDKLGWVSRCNRNINVYGIESII